MSPEQALGKNIDQRSDLFSLGVSLYKICAQKPPFETDNIGTTIQNILTKKVENLSSINIKTPLWFSDLISALLAKNREDRPDSAEVVLNIINSNYKTETAGKKSLEFKPSHPGNVYKFTNSVLHYFNPKNLRHIFIWVFPIIIIVIYLIFQQSDEVRSESTMQLNYHEKVQNTVIPDTKLLNAKDKNSADNYIVENSINEPLNASPFDLVRTIKKNENPPDTSASIPRLEQSKVFIIAKPWAGVYIDSIYYEETPLRKPISLNPGNHFIELKNPNYKTFSQHFEFRPAQTETLIVDMQINVGFLKIRVLPWAKIYIDGEYQETSPIEIPLTLEAGKHILTLTNPNYGSIKDTIEVISGKTLDKKFHFSK